jgi:hypothetical protein
MREIAVFALALLVSTNTRSTHAATADIVLATNTRATVYLEVDDQDNKLIDSGTGFIASHDGYIITVAHLKADQAQRMWAIIGQREGTRYPLNFRDADETSDVALWQLPQSATCRYAVTMGTSPVRVLDRVLALGFPGKEGLTPSSVGIVNLSSQVGNYKADGYLQEGNSGGPVFNELGLVVAIVQGGTRPGTANNDLIPIAPGLALLKKHGVAAGYDSPVPFANSCYVPCPDPSHGVASWQSEVSWTANSGELAGGHNQVDECNALIAAALAAHPGSQIELAPGASGRWENSHKDVLGGMHYTYYCKGVLRSGPIYNVRQSPACPLGGY